MRNIVKPSLRVPLAATFLAAASAHAFAQVRDARVLTARAGVVNFVSGHVEYNREGETAWRALSDRDELRSGDVARSGAGARAEVLLNPGSYFRLGGASQFELVDASLDSLRLRLTRGSAVVEATGYNDLDLSIVIETPQTRVEILRTGIYRLNVLPSGVTEVAVWKGRALVGARGETLVKGGRVASVGAGAGVQVAKLDKDGRDELDLWSRERGRELAKMNERFARREVRSAFTGLDLFGAGYGFGGVWVSYGGCYTFLPYLSYWRSPYGYGYGSWFYPLPRGCMQCPSRGGVVVGGGGYSYPPPGVGGAGFPAGGRGTVGAGGGAGGPVRQTPMPSAAPVRERGETVRPMPERRPSFPVERPSVGRGVGPRGTVRDQ